MPEPKAIQIMRTLSKDELKEFGRFADSPYFNRLSDVTRLFNLLKKQHPEFEPDKIENRKLFGRLFPEKKYNDARMRNLMSDLGKLSEKFLLYKSYDEDKNYGEFLYLNSLLGRKLYALFQKSSSSFEKKLHSYDVSDINLKRFMFEMVKYDFYLDTNQQHKSAETAYKKYGYFVDLILQTMTRGLYDFKVHKNMHSYDSGNVLKSFAESFDFDKFIKLIEADRSETLLIRIAHYTFNLLCGVNFDWNLHQLLNLVRKHENELTHQNKYDIFLNLQNLLAFKIYEDGHDYERLRLELNKEAAMKKFYCHDVKKKLMPLIFFINGINLSLKYDQSDYAVYLIRNFLNNLPHDSRAAARHYSQAMLEFKFGNFRKSMDEVSKVDYKIAPLRKHVKNLMLLLYYELGYMDSAESLAISYRQYLSRNNGFEGMYGEWYDNFLKLYSMLIKLNINDDRAREKLVERIRSTKKTLFKEWLLAKTQSHSGEFRIAN